MHCLRKVNRELICSKPTTVAATVMTDCWHLQSAANCLHCSSLPLASVAMFVHRTTRPCLIIIISQCRWSPAATASLIQLGKRLRQHSSNKVLGFTAGPEERAKTQWIYSYCTFTKHKALNKRFVWIRIRKEAVWSWCSCDCPARTFIAAHTPLTTVALLFGGIRGNLNWSFQAGN